MNTWIWYFSYLQKTYSPVKVIDVRKPNYTLSQVRWFRVGGSGFLRHFVKDLLWSINDLEFLIFLHTKAQIYLCVLGSTVVPLCLWAIGSRTPMVPKSEDIWVSYIKYLSISIWPSPISSNLSIFFRVLTIPAQCKWYVVKGKISRESQ
jgi:hypothetical protein